MTTSTDPPLLPVGQPDILTFSQLRLDLQATAPVCRISTPAGDEGWLVTRHAEVKSLLQDERLGRTHPDPPSAPRYLKDPMLDMLITDTDAEAERRLHEQKRVLYTASFAARRMLEQQPRVQAIADATLDAIEAKGPPADLHTDFSARFARRSLGDILGVPVTELTALLDRMEYVGTVDEETGEERGMDSVFAFTAELCRQKRQQPGDDVMSHFAEAGMTDDEVGMHVTMLLFTGLAGTAAHLDFGALLFLKNPEERAKAMADPEIMSRGVEEVLRATVGSPVLPRYAVEDIDIGGVTIREGDLVLLDFSLANFDHRVYEAPERFDVARFPNPQMSFGHGMRHCTGAPLVRILLKSAFTTLFDRLPGIRLAVPEEELRSHPGGRLAGGLAELPVRW